MNLKVFASLFLVSCGPLVSVPSVPDFSSAHSVALDGMIRDGKLTSTSDNPSVLQSEIRSQLYYTIGALNGHSGVADLNRTEVSIQDVTRLENNLYQASYVAKLFIAWPRHTPPPATLALTLPARADTTGLSRFFSAYNTSACLDFGAHNVSSGTFWYYYRPDNQNCSLARPTLPNLQLATRVHAELSVSAENTNGSFPEYRRIWQDGKLIVTAIFGMAESAERSEYDEGVQAYAELYHELIETFGKPASSTLDDDQTFLSQRRIQMRYHLAPGDVEVHLFLVPGIREVDDDFEQEYNALTERSDFVAYSGHSGLGANIRALARMGHFVKDQYQIFLINGCDTFAYVDNSLRDAHALVNPGSSPHKFFDVITNAMPAYFVTNAEANLAVIKALVERQKTYEAILAEFDSSQHAVVTGDEDNESL